MGILFVGTPSFAVPSLRRLHADGHAILAVVTQPDRPAGRGRKPARSAVKQAALDLRIPVIQPDTLRDPEVVAQLRSLGPEAVVAVAYGQILRPDVLQIAPRGVLNVHPSLLPRWRGASPIAGAILAGDELTGVTIMLMDPGMDTGPILSQRTHPISPDDTSGSLTEALASVGADLLAETLPAWLAGEIQPQPQDDSAATVTRLVKKEDGEIDWHLPASDIWRRVRGYNPWPAAFTSLGDETLKIWKALPIDSNSAEQPGTIVPLAEPIGAAFGVQTGDGTLAVLEAQRPGRKRMSSAELLRGMPDLIARRLSPIRG